MLHKSYIFVLILCYFSCAFSQIEKNSEQIVVVVNETMASSQATMYLLEKEDNKWTYNTKSWNVVIGRNGLAWGKGEFTLPSDDMKQKKEGDGKSPAGVFKINSMLYGYSEKPPKDTKLKYTQVTSDWRGIDDSKSAYYNQIIDTKKIEKQDWDSFEYMKRKDHLYRWVLVVDHNTMPAKPGAGSCIFIHLWRSSESNTAGCTAMTEKNILYLIKWLDPEKKPKIIQLSKRLYQGYCGKLGLPILPEKKTMRK